jgi:hypothetical protein
VGRRASLPLHFSPAVLGLDLDRLPPYGRDDHPDPRRADQNFSTPGTISRHYPIENTILHSNTTVEVAIKKIHAYVDKLKVVPLG